MPKEGHTEDHIVAVVRHLEAGAQVAAICRKPGISQATYCLRKRPYSDVEVSEQRPLGFRQESGMVTMVAKSWVRSAFQTGTMFRSVSASS
jgi:hypothetical protein